jgi:hypothetical protein
MAVTRAYAWRLTVHEGYERGRRALVRSQSRSHCGADPAADLYGLRSGISSNAGT